MPLTDSFENEIIDYFMRGQIVSGGTAYLALSTTTPTETGSNFTEPDTVNGYARQPLSLGAPSTGSANNVGSVTFGPCSISNWGSITHIGIFFVSSGGTLKAYKNISPKTVNIGQTISWADGLLTVSFD